MSDRSALYKAIVANPDDDTLRLAYADWLEESGDAKAAKYIRAACELARLDDEDPSLATFPEEPPSFWKDLDPRLAHRQTQLAAGTLPREHSRVETARLPKLDGVDYGLKRSPHEPYRRGFIEQVIFADADAFLRHGQAVSRIAPIRSVVIRQLYPDDARRIAAASQFAQVRSLTVLSQAVWGEELRALGESDKVNRVRSLTISSAKPGCLAALAESKHWVGLRRLVLDRAEIQEDVPGADEELGALAAAKHLRKLTSLTLCGLRFETNAAKALASAKWPELRRLEIRYEGPPIGPAIADATDLKKLRSLTLASSYLDGTDCARVITSPKLPSLASLDLSWNAVKGFGKRDFSGAKRTPIRHLNLADNDHPVTKEWLPLFRWVADSEVVSLSISGTKLATDGIRALIECGDYPNLRRLDLRDGRSTVAPKPAITRLQKHFGDRLRAGRRAG
jgi:uncharacterized protein (TIGR02996 family)